MQYKAAFPRDANGVPFYDPNYGFVATKTVTFTGGTNANGDFDGTGNPSTLFTVTGTIRCKLLAKCTTNLAGASATLSVGTALSAAGLIALTTATDIDAGEIWHDANPDASVELSSVLTEKIVSQDIKATVGTANITSGVIVFTLYWYPLSYDGNVVAA
jgi:hypothetical protein